MTKSDGAQLIAIEVGDAGALILPKEMLARLNLKEGDVLHAVAHPDGGLTLSVRDSVHAREMAFARQAFHEYADTFKALAK